MIEKTLKKGKIYKVFHNRDNFERNFPRDYLLVCPETDVVLKEDFKSKYSFINYKNLFIVCFDGNISFCCASCLDSQCKLGQLDGKDIMDIRRVMERAEMKDFIYNRKLNMICEKKRKE